MKIAYHFMIPRPSRPELDGAVQEALWLRERFGGSISFLYPLQRFSRLIPGWLCGVNSVPRLRGLDRAVDLHHLFTPGLPSYPFLNGLRKPSVCTVQTSLGPQAHVKRMRTRPRVMSLVASDPRDVNYLEAATGASAIWVPPGVDAAAFRRRPPPTGEDFTVLVGSAPWTLRQFSTKGIDQLLAAARRLPRLRLIFLWRGALRDDLAKRIDRAGLAARTKVLFERVDVAGLLESVHAVAVLAEKPKLIKSFPHSALEALAAGRPVLTSSGLAIADFVRRHRTGAVVNALSVNSVLAGLRGIMEDYAQLLQNAMESDLSAFSRERFLDSYKQIYLDALQES